MRRYDLEGLRQSQKTVLFSLVTDEDPRGRNLSLQFTPLACYVIARQRPRLVRPSPANTGEQRGRVGVTNIIICSQLACDHCKVFRAELVSTPPDGLDTLTISSSQKEVEDDQSEAMKQLARIFDSSISLVQYHRQGVKLIAVFSKVFSGLD